MHFFTDRNLGRRFPEVLREAGLEVTAHDDLFSPTTEDVTWIPDVARRGLVAVTQDSRTVAGITLGRRLIGQIHSRLQITCCYSRHASPSMMRCMNPSNSGTLRRAVRDRTTPLPPKK